MTLSGETPPPRGSLRYVHVREGRIIGAGRSKPDQVRANERPDGLVDQQVKGRSPQGEEPALPCCKRLIEKLNQQGAAWGDPQVPSGREDGVDCVAFDTNSSGELKIQHTRAIHDEELWSKLARRGEAGIDEESPDVVADGLRAAIARKASSASSDVVLALDADLVPIASLDAVRSAFERRHSDWATALPYRGIWVVGLTPSSTWKVAPRE